MLSSPTLESLQHDLETEIDALTIQIADGTYKTLEDYKRAVGMRAGLKKAVDMIVGRRTRATPPVARISDEAVATL